MPRMQVVSISRWGEGGIQVNFDLSEITEGSSTNHTEMAMSKDPSEFSRLMAMKLYEEFDVDSKKIISTP